MFLTGVKHLSVLIRPPPSRSEIGFYGSQFLDVESDNHRRLHDYLYGRRRRRFLWDFDGSFVVDRPLRNFSFPRRCPVQVPNTTTAEPIDLCRLMYGWKELKGSHCVHDYGIVDGSTLVYEKRCLLPGGAKTKRGSSEL